MRLFSQDAEIFAVGVKIIGDEVRRAYRSGK